MLKVKENPALLASVDNCPAYEDEFPPEYKRVVAEFASKIEEQFKI